MTPEFSSRTQFACSVLDSVSLRLDLGPGPGLLERLRRCALYRNRITLGSKSKTLQHGPADKSILLVTNSAVAVGFGTSFPGYYDTRAKHIPTMIPTNALDLNNSTV